MPTITIPFGQFIQARDYGHAFCSYGISERCLRCGQLHSDIAADSWPACPGPAPFARCVEVLKYTPPSQGFLEALAEINWTQDPSQWSIGLVGQFVDPAPARAPPTVSTPFPAAALRRRKQPIGLLTPGVD